MAALAAMARGEGEPGTSAVECRAVTPGFMAELHGVCVTEVHAVLQFLVGRWWDTDGATWAERLALKHAARTTVAAARSTLPWTDS